MKNSSYLFFIIILFCKDCFCQTFLNGSFEINTTVTRQINLTNAEYNSIMVHSFAFGSKGNMDIIIGDGSCGFAQHGNYFVALTGGGTDAISLELSEPLVAGLSYSISFYDRYCRFTVIHPFQIGLSTSNKNFGSVIYTAPKPISSWSLRTFSFVAPNNGQFITIRITEGGSSGGISEGTWGHIDNFSIDNCSVQLDIGNDTTLCLGDAFTLDATISNGTYLWQDSSTNSTFTVNQEGKYWVRATNGCGTMSDTIWVSERDCEILLEIPTIFTPNNDGFNDLFVPIISKGIISMKTIIYDRWGNNVFETDNPLIRWDGNRIAEGTYFWIVYYTDINEVENKLIGNVTILK